MASTRACIACDKLCSRASALKAHIATCKPLAALQELERADKNRRRRPSDTSVSNDSAQGNGDGGEPIVAPDGLPAHTGPAETEGASPVVAVDPTPGTAPVVPQEPEQPQQQDAIGAFDDIFQYRDDPDSDSGEREWESNSDVEENLGDAAPAGDAGDDNRADSATQGSVTFSQGRMASSSATANCVRKEYPEREGRRPGEKLHKYVAQTTVQPLLTHMYRNKSRPDEPIDPEDGLQNLFDFGFAQWLMNENISSKAIDRLIKDPRLEQLAALVSWSSADELKQKMKRMGTTTSDAVGRWHKKEFTIDTIRLGGTKNWLRYRKVEDAVRFLLGHTGFKGDMIYKLYYTLNVENV
ncbi:hypothetical protein LTR85_002050 [Meristemomyces frigidus]|nr:hypothetical protein LTR85_002050 [Meristemomyces frigidus]